MKIVGVVLAIVIALVLVANLVPNAISTFYSASTSGWNTGAASMWALIPLFVIIGLVVYFIKGFVGNKK